MISNESIKTIAKKYQTTELNVRREYFQHLFLSYFYQQPHSDKIFFKGGTALRILYNSPRFSEDLDFSATMSDIKAIETSIVSTLEEIEREGVDTNIQEAKMTSGGYLAIISFVINHLTTSIQLEISLREKKKKGEAATIASDFMPSYTLMHLKKEDLIKEKIQALLSRKKPRDFYDVYFLLRANLVMVKERALLSKVSQELKNTRISFEKELKLFLPKNHQMIIKNLKSALEREIKRSEDNSALTRRRLSLASGFQLL